MLTSTTGLSTATPTTAHHPVAALPCFLHTPLASGPPASPPLRENPYAPHPP